MSGTLKLTGIVAGYKGTDVLAGIDLQLPRAQSVAILGPNGAGKSTLLRVISGQLPIRSGSREVDGVDTSQLRAYQMARRGVRWVGEPRPLATSLTVEDNLRVGGHLRMREYARLSAWVFELMPILWEKRAERAGALSGGQQQMLAIGQALMSEPTHLLLDEPSIGLAPHVVTQLAELITMLRDGGVGIAWAEQFPDIALAHSDHVLVLGAGRIQLSGRPDEIDRDQLERAYVGLPIVDDGGSVDG